MRYCIPMVILIMLFSACDCIAKQQKYVNVLVVTQDKENLSKDEIVLRNAINENNLDKVKEIISNGTDVNLRVQETCIGVGPNFYVTPLQLASLRGHDEIVKYLLGKGANVDLKDSDGNPVLVGINKISILKLLLNAGAKVNDTNSFGETPLMLAASFGYKDAVEILLLHGAEVNAKGKDGSTALLYSSKKGYTTITETLIHFGAKIDLPDDKGTTALMWAANYDQLETVKLLISVGADINAKDLDGKTVLDYVQPNDYFPNSKAIREILISSKNLLKMGKIPCAST